MALVVKNPPTFAGGVRDVDSISGLERAPGGGQMWIQSLGWKEPLEEGTATHSSILG